MCNNTSYAAILPSQKFEIEKEKNSFFFFIANIMEHLQLYQAMAGKKSTKIIYNKMH